MWGVYGRFQKRHAPPLQTSKNIWMSDGFIITFASEIPLFVQ
jgi:hypothetical protein